MSNMSRIADYVRSITDSEEEYNKIIEECHLFMNDNNKPYDSLSKKAFATVINWEQEESYSGKTNHNLINEWEGY